MLCPRRRNMATLVKAFEAGKACGNSESACGSVTAADWAEYCNAVRNDGEQHDWCAEMEEHQRGHAEGRAQWKAEHPYSVLLWGSDPDAGNDDCNTGVDFATREEALAAFENPFAHVNTVYHQP